MVCNRDEQRSRPQATPPRVQRRAATTAMWPVDPAGGGTWIAVNDAGLVLALLNRTSLRASRRTVRGVSRGTIIPRLADSTSLADAVERGLALDVVGLQPFTVVMVQAASFATLTSVEGRQTVRMGTLATPRLFTSSSLGDDIVTVPRCELFAQLVTANPIPLQGQDEFHRHQWPSRPDISVQMSRTDASTVSRTVVDVTPATFAIRYTPLRQ
jgi:hypothetical protein